MSFSSKSATIVTLGCSKNLVDSEHLGAALHAHGWSIRYDEEPLASDLVILNTCGFIGDAKEESIEYILRAEALLREGLAADVIVMGCLSERYRDELKAEIPGIAHWFGVRDQAELLELLDCPETPKAMPPRRLSTPKHYAYLKISEGCNRGCHFCAIPAIRGRYTSIPIRRLLHEAQTLVDQGTKELLLIAQELTTYGSDLRDDSSLVTLVEQLAMLDQLKWIRLHYAYPTGFPEEIFTWMRDCSKACRYLDIPIQHIADGVLKSMNRHHDEATTRRLLTRLREVVPDVTLRTSLIVGYPTESEEDFKTLLRFIQEVEFDHLGAFTYSEEEGTFAARRLANVVPEEVKQERLARLMEVQEEIAQRRKSRHVGKILDVLVDRRLDAQSVLGRTEFDSPEVDGEVIVHDPIGRLEPGDFIPVHIEAVDSYDLVGKWHRDPKHKPVW